MVQSTQKTVTSRSDETAVSSDALTELSLKLDLPETTVVSVLSLFYDEYHPYLQITTDYINRQDWAALEAYVHKVKGSSGSLQMQKLRLQLADLELRLKKGEQVTVEQLQPFYQEMQTAITLFGLDTIKPV